VESSWGCAVSELGDRVGGITCEEKKGRRPRGWCGEPSRGPGSRVSPDAHESRGRMDGPYAMQLVGSVQGTAGNHRCGREVEEGVRVDQVHGELNKSRRASDGRPAARAVDSVQARLGLARGTDVIRICGRNAALFLSGSGVLQRARARLYCLPVDFHSLDGVWVRAFSWPADQ
jgi:hypothetical protein